MLSFILNWIGIGADYLASGLLFFGGATLAFYVAVAFPIPVVAPIVKWVGYVLMVLGVIFGFFSYGKSVGAADCYAAWRKADLQFQTDRQNQETAAANVASATATAQAQALAKQNDDLQKQIQNYQSKVAKAGSCRMSTIDDDRRLCNLLGNGAAGCKGSK
jgi:hypothetical protein